MSVYSADKKVSQLLEDWDEVLNTEEVDEISDPHKKAVTARLLENQDQAMITEAPTQSVGTFGDGNGGIDTWDPILISMIRRSIPKMIAFDIFGVQPMTGPTGLIFAMKSTYGDDADPQSATEALYNEPDTGFSGARSDLTTKNATPTWEGGGTPDGTLTDPTAVNYGHGIGMAVADAESLGDGTNVWNEMSFSIEKATVTVGSRALRATWSHELTQDLKAVHGLDAETELSNMLSTEILNEINREMVRRCYVMSQNGAADATVAGTFNLNVDSDGRWAVEKFKGLMFQLEKEANAIAIDTRRGKGNFIICSSNVASALAMTGLLDTGGKGSQFVNPGVVDPTGTTFVGVLNGRTKVFVDPYATVEFICIGFKGATAYDSGAFYCPYVPLTMYRATTEDGFQPRIGFKTRYGFEPHPFASADGINPASDAGNNKYYRIFLVENL